MKHVIFIFLAFLLSGCSTVGYYMDAINGHFEITTKATPIDEAIDENISDELRIKLINFKEARKFAVEELLLPANDSYSEYADIGRPFAVWNVIAAPGYSVEPKKWCFLFVGCINYRGYFNKQDADEYANELEQQGYDVYVAGARAYSTLGWFNDPLLNTMMYKSEAARVGILFHELAHQKVYIEDDSAFNEAFATTVEQEGVRRWFKSTDSFNELAEYEEFIKRKNDFNSLLKCYRSKLDNAYRQISNNQEKLTRKKQLFFELKQEYAQLKANNWNGYSGYDQWMEQELNNAHLAIVATYNDLVPVFTEAINKKSISDFYAYIVNLSEKDPQYRKQLLNY